MTFIREAGWPIFPVIALGIASVFFSYGYMKHRSRDALALACSLVVATLIMGVLGTVLGVQRSAEFITQTPERWIFLVGLKESLYNLAVGLLFALADALMFALAFVSPAESRKVPASC